MTEHIARGFSFFYSDRTLQVKVTVRPWSVFERSVWISVWMWRRVCESPQWPECVYCWSDGGRGGSAVTDELAVDLGGLGESLSVCYSWEAPCALTSSSTVIEFTIMHHSSKVYTTPKHTKGNILDFKPRCCSCKSLSTNITDDFICIVFLFVF